MGISTRVIPLVLAMLFLACARTNIEAETPEFRAMWVTAWQSALLTPAEVDETIRLAKSANLNALLVQVRKTGDAYYISDYEPRGENLSLADYDPLDYIIKQAHAAGLEVHVWLNTYKVWQSKTPPKSPEHVFNKHPEWINKTNTGQNNAEGQFALDPGIREVQDHTFNVYLDVVRKYDVDGIHFDYVRYWGKSFGYSDLAVARFNQEKGRAGIPDSADPVWCQWRRDRVTDLVRSVYNAVKKIKPDVKVTAAVICSGECTSFKDTRPYKSFFQDWEGWLREGIIDAVIPMNYRNEVNPTDARQFREWTSAMARWKHGRRIYNGLSITKTSSLITQIKESRYRGLDGFVGFHFNASADRAGIASALREHVFQAQVPTPWGSSGTIQVASVPDAPSGPKELYSRAVYSASRGGLDEAIELMKQAVEANPDYVEAHYRLGSYYLQKDMNDEATKEFQEVLRLNPMHGGAKVALRRISSQPPTTSSQ